MCLFSALCVDRRFRAMCLFVKQIGYNIFTSLPADVLWGSFERTPKDATTERDKRWLGGDHALMWHQKKEETEGILDLMRLAAHK